MQPGSNLIKKRSKFILFDKSYDLVYSKSGNDKAMRANKFKF